MIKTAFISLLFTSLSLLSFAQSNAIIGKYVISDTAHVSRLKNEEITLNADNTFKYSAQGLKSGKVKKSGTWSVKNDTLILNENNPAFQQVLSVTEQTSPAVSSGYVSITANYNDNSKLIYQVAATHVDTTLTLSDVKKMVMIPLHALTEFTVSSPLYDYPLYTVKNPQANQFTVQLAPGPLFINEKWLIKNGTIVPKGANGLSADYILRKVQ